VQAARIRSQPYCAFYAMPKPLGDYIRGLPRPFGGSEGLAPKEIDPAAKAELLTLADNWRRAASDYQHVEKLECFPSTYKASAQPSSEALI